MSQTLYKPLINWLKIGALMVVVMVVIGGVTRLTNSGLSMVDWKLFHGSIPPLNEADWQETFDAYKNYPEYNLVNFDMSLSEFKSIFFWEWLHRVWGRLIGIVFIVPFFYFIRKGKVEKPMMSKLLLLLGLGALQAFFGWYMVKSGLVKDPNVSHYRLAIHLITAFATFAYIQWLILNLSKTPGAVRRGGDSMLKKLLYILFPLVVLQIIYGAFVAGLDAGHVFPTWPKMGPFWMPPQIGNDFSTNGLSSLFGMPVTVQFIHRILAYTITILIAGIWIRSRKLMKISLQKKAANYLLIAVLIQVVLGIGTLVMHVPLFMGILHQLGALVLLAGTIDLVFHSRNKVATYGWQEQLIA